MLDKLALVDTNVLIYAFSKESEYYKASRELLNQAQEGKLSLCVAPQVLAEFYAIASDKRRTSAPQKPTEVLLASDTTKQEELEALKMLWCTRQDSNL
jgi:predicted nucleic acid-binding protein